MSEIAIRVCDLGKRYRIGIKRESYKTLRDTLADTLTAPFRKAGGLLRGRSKGGAPLDSTFWALRDISFEVKRGETLGIIGRNGAGKSTLLKILSRITNPDRGFAEIRGRVGSLLEVGTGFHPELTGAENIYLNGAILGMKRAHIQRKFDEIVAFAEVEKFINTPVKHYSSGMYLRLAFAVAAHLEPEILFVDEVLAVGDAQFQKKCLNKMHDVEQQGRTVFFVSHNLAAVTRLCKRVILLDEGRIQQDGAAQRVVSAYLNTIRGTAGIREWNDPAKAPGNDIVRLRLVKVLGEDGGVADSVDIRQPVGIQIEYDVLKPGHHLVPLFTLYNEQEVLLFVANDLDPEWRNRPRAKGCYVSTAWIPGNFLAEGLMTVGVGIQTHSPFIVHVDEPTSVSFNVVDTVDGQSARGDYGGGMPGAVRPLLQWTTHFTASASNENMAPSDWGEPDFPPGASARGQ